MELYKGHGLTIRKVVTRIGGACVYVFIYFLHFFAWTSQRCSLVANDAAKCYVQAKL